MPLHVYFTFWRIFLPFTEKHCYHIIGFVQNVCTRRLTFLSPFESSLRIQPRGNSVILKKINKLEQMQNSFNGRDFLFLLAVSLASPSRFLKLNKYSVREIIYFYFKRLPFISKQLRISLSCQL